MLVPKSLTPNTLRPAELIHSGKKRIRLSNILADKLPSTPHRLQIQSPYETSFRALPPKGKRKGNSIGLSNRRVSLADTKAHTSVTPIYANPHSKSRSPKAHSREQSSKMRLRRFTRSPSPALIPSNSKITPSEWERRTAFPKSATPDIGLRSESSGENIIQTPAEEEDGRLSPALAYSKILEKSINSYMNLSKAKLPKSQNELLTLHGCLLRSDEFVPMPRGSEAEPEPAICSKRFTLVPDEPVAPSLVPVSPLVRRLKQFRHFEPAKQP